MNHVTKLAMASLIGTLGLTMAQPAQSALVCASGVCTDTVTLGPIPTEINGGTALFPLFDSNIGNLTGATITLTAESRIRTGSTLTNNAPQTQSFSVRQDSLFSVVDSTVPGGAIDIAIQAVSLIPTTGLVQFNNVPGMAGAPANTIPFGPVTNTDTANLIVALAALQAAGGGTHTLTVDTLTTTTFVGGGGNISANFLTEGLFELAIRYEYIGIPRNDTPEPLTLGLLGVGIAGLGIAKMVRRRPKTDAA